MDTIYIIGHKNPDNDCTIAPIALAYLLNKINSKNTYKPAMAGTIRDVTKNILVRFGVKLPKVINGAGKKLILVDHNEKAQQVDGIAEAVILGVYDHHKINFAYKDIIPMRVEVIGSSSSLVYKMFKEKNIIPPQEIASILLAAVLDDTVILSSPTTTSEDKQIVAELVDITELDYLNFGKEIFKMKSNISEKTSRQIITEDLKEMEFAGRSFAIGQAETIDISEFNERIDDIKSEIKLLKKEKNYHTIIFFITDILKKGSKFIVFSEDSSLFEQAFRVTLIDNEVYIDGVLSRKKQVVLPLMDAIS